MTYTKAVFQVLSNYIYSNMYQPEILQRRHWDKLCATVTKMHILCLKCLHFRHEILVRVRFQETPVRKLRCQVGCMVKRICMMIPDVNDRVNGCVSFRTLQLAGFQSRPPPSQNQLQLSLIVNKKMEEWTCSGLGEGLLNIQTNIRIHTYCIPDKEHILVHECV